MICAVDIVCIVRCKREGNSQREILPAAPSEIQYVSNDDYRGPKHHEPRRRFNQYGIRQYIQNRLQISYQQMIEERGKYHVHDH